MASQSLFASPSPEVFTSPESEDDMQHQFDTCAGLYLIATDAIYFSVFSPNLVQQIGLWCFSYLECTLQSEHYFQFSCKSILVLEPKNWIKHHVEWTQSGSNNPAVGRGWFGVNTISLMITPKLVLHKNETNYRC